MSLTYYPSSWYYNASVHGFLEVLAIGLGEDYIKTLLNEDGSVDLNDKLIKTILDTNSEKPVVPLEKLKEVPSDLPETKRLAWWWIVKSMEIRSTEHESWSNQEKVDKTISSYFVGNKGFYVNLIQPRDTKADFLDKWFAMENNEMGIINCSFCGQPFVINEEEKEYYHYLTSALSSMISSSTAFPNLFFDGQPAAPICRHCRWPLICFHLVNPNGLFINAGSFRLNWHLNRLLDRKSNFSSNKYSGLIDALFNESRLQTTFHKAETYLYQLWRQIKQTWEKVLLKNLLS